MSSTFGQRIRLSIFGQSHGEKLGCVLDGLPAGEPVDMDGLRAFMARRAPGGPYATRRREPDTPQIVSGLYQGVTCGAPLCVLIDNTDTRPGDYAALRDMPRPGHADYPAQVKYHGAQDVRGGGHFSARVTAACCAAGGILLQLLRRRGIVIGAHLLSVGTVSDLRFDPLRVDAAALAAAQTGFPVVSDEVGRRMQALIEETRARGDSVGGIVECAVLGLPVGLGSPMFDGIENLIARAVFAIPAVKGIEFGEGFAAASLFGSQNNDAYEWRDGGPAVQSNHAGGILGGLTDGAPVIFRAAFKPTPSIALAQHTVSFSARRDAILEISGRHDPCVAVRAVPIVEAAAAIALAEEVLTDERSRAWN